MAVDDLALEHMEEFEPGMLEDREDIGFSGEQYHIGLDHDRPMRAVAEQLVLMAGPRAAPLDGQALPRLDEGGVADFLIGAEQAPSPAHAAPATGLAAIDSDGEVAPFSILDSMPADMSAALASLGDGEAELFADTLDLAGRSPPPAVCPAPRGPHAAPGSA